MSYVGIINQNELEQVLAIVFRMLSRTEHQYHDNTKKRNGENEYVWV